MGEDQIAIDSAAIRALGPKEIAKVFEMKETAMRKVGIGHIAANTSGIKNYGEKKIVG